MEQNKKQTNLSFEEAIEQLEDIVGKLENGDVPLENAIELYQQGMKLSQLCSLKLQQVEKKIEMLVEADGNFSKKTFVAAMEDKGDPV